MVVVVVNFFQKGEMSREISSNDVVLILKQNRLELVSHFRHNFMNKIITKVMVNRMKPWLGDLIIEN